MRSKYLPATNSLDDLYMISFLQNMCIVHTPRNDASVDLNSNALMLKTKLLGQVSDIDSTFKLACFTIKVQFHMYYLTMKLY